MKKSIRKKVLHVVALVLFCFQLFSFSITSFPTKVYAATPSTPTNFVVTAGSWSAALSWSGVSASPAVTDYQIDYKLTTTGLWTTFSDGVTTRTTGTVTSLVNETGYDFRVAAINTDGTSSFTTVTGVIISAVPVPTVLFTFEGDYNDWSSHGNNAINAGSASIATDATRGQVVKMVWINDSYLNVPVALPPSFTKAVRVYAAAGGIRNIMTNGTYGDKTGSNIFQLNSSSQLNAGHFSWSTQANYATEISTFTTGQWIHVAETYDGVTKIYSLYRNGVLVATGTAVSAPPSSTGMSIGAYASNNGVWSGYMDNAEMRSGALTQTQISSVYNGNLWVQSAIPSVVPTNFTVTSLDTGGVTLAWSWVWAYPSVIDYQIEYKITTGATWNVFPDAVSVATTWVVTGLVYKMWYDFRVSAVNAIGTWSASSVATWSTAYVPYPLFVLTFEWNNYNDISPFNNNAINAGSASIVTDTGSRGGKW